MIQEDPIIPPTELVKEWSCDCSFTHPYPRDLYIANLAARWGADQELEACCEWLNCELGTGWAHGTKLRAARRPKPPSLKEQALEVFDKLEHLFDGYGHDGPTIRRALESLPE